MVDASTGQMAAAVANFRDTVKWFAASLAGLGAVFVVGTSLTNLGGLVRWRLALAVATGAAGIFFVGFCLDILLKLLAPRICFIDEIEQDVKLKAFVEAHAVMLLPAEYSNDAGSFPRRLRQAYEQLAAATEPTENSTQAEIQEWKRLVDEFNRVQDQVEDLPQYIMVWKLRNDFYQARPKLLGAALLAAICLGAFAWAANPPKPSPGPQVIVEQFP